jgi:hypothetical protein
MSLTEGRNWCKAKGKDIKIIGTRDHFLVCSKALEKYNAGVVAPRCCRYNLTVKSLIFGSTGAS